MITTINVNNVKAMFKEEAQKKLTDIGLQALRDVKLNTPVDTGALRNAWALDVRDLEFELKNPTEYANHVESWKHMLLFAMLDAENRAITEFGGN
jgi:hypothetical protein